MLASIATGTTTPDALLLVLFVASVLGWIGAAIGGGLALAGAITQATKGQPSGTGQNPWNSTPFGSQGPTNPFGTTGVGGPKATGGYYDADGKWVPGWTEQGNATKALGWGESNFGNNAEAIGGARDQQGDARAEYQKALAMLQNRATGADSVVAQQAQAERDRAQRTFASQLATMGGQGYYSPGAARQAMLQSSGFQQNIAAQMAAASAQERQAAQDAYLKGVGGMREQDLGLMSKELEQERQRQAYLAAMQQASQGWQGLGLQDKWKQQQGTLDWQRLLGTVGAETAKSQQDASNANSNFWNQMGGGLMGAGGGVANYFGTLPQTSGGGGSGSTDSHDAGTMYGYADEYKP